jgi:hypothetical protein
MHSTHDFGAPSARVHAERTQTFHACTQTLSATQCQAGQNGLEEDGAALGVTMGIAWGGAQGTVGTGPWDVTHGL